MSDVCYVFSDLGQAQRPYLVGRLRAPTGRPGEFQYARSFLESNNAHSLDPIHLPLNPAACAAAQHPFVHGVFLDAGPDDWGRRSLLFRGKPADGIDALMYGSGSGVGALQFSLSRDAVKTRPTAPTLDELGSLLEVVLRIDAGSTAPVPTHISKLLDAGTSMGGARPKAVVSDAGTLYLAKFPSARDVVDQPAVECATLSLAERAGLRVPRHRVVPIAGRNVLLVERFDVVPGTLGAQRFHYLSMASLLVVGRRLRADAYRHEVSYMGLASVVNAHGDGTADSQREIFRRMCFNVLMGHVDDHSRNHGFLVRAPGGPLELAPLFDVAPSNGTAESIALLKADQAIGIGQSAGAARSVDNALSAYRDFGFKHLDDARQELHDVAGVCALWEASFLGSGVSQRDCDLIRHRVMALPGYQLRHTPTSTSPRL